MGAVSGIGYDSAFCCRRPNYGLFGQRAGVFLEMPRNTVSALWHHGCDVYPGALGHLPSYDAWRAYSGSGIFERDNYLLPEPRVENKVREYYLSARYDTYRGSLTLHELLNSFIRRVGIDEEDFAEMFGI